MFFKQVAGMKSFIFMFLVSSIFFMASSASARTAYDSFPGLLLNTQKWTKCEAVREVTGGELVSKVANNPGSPNVRVDTSFLNPTDINSIESTITVKSATLADTGTGKESSARLQGFFYNTQSAGGATGDVWAGVKIGNRGSGLEAWWEVYEALNDSRTLMDEVGSGTLIAPDDVSPLLYDTAYQARLTYNGDNQFTFEVNSVSYTFTTGPARARPPLTSFKGLAAAAYGTSGNAYASVLFDDVKVNGTSFDTFSSSPLDNTKWNTLEEVREIAGGKARLDIHANGSQRDNTLSFPDNNLNYIEAKFLVRSDSILSSGAQGITRIAGYYYNETGTPYDGEKNDVWIDHRITLNDSGNLSASCTLWRSDTTNGSSGTTLFWQAFGTPLSFDTEYTLSVERRGQQFVFKLDNETYVYNVQTTMYEPSNGQLRQIRTRVYADPGESGYMKTTIDDVYTEKDDRLFKDVFYDQFPGPFLDETKWTEDEVVREVKNEKLSQKISNRSSRVDRRMSTRFIDPSTILSIESKITVTAATILDTGAYKESAAILDGIFYNTQSAGGETGDIWAGVKIGDRGFGLEAWWEVYEALSDDGVRGDMEERGSGTLIAHDAPIPLTYDTAYQAIITYDGDNQFTFEVNGVPYAFTTGPAKLRSPVSSFKALSTSAYGTAGNAHTSVLFDDVKINGATYDTFSTSPLNLSKWLDPETVKEIKNGKARLNIQTKDSRKDNTLYFPDNDFNYLEAKCLIESGSIISSGATGRVRLAGFYYNEAGIPYNGYQNDVWVENRINLNDDNSLTASCSLYRMDTSDSWGPGTTLFYQSYSTALSFDTEYTLSIERKGSTFIFKLNNEAYSHDVTSAMHQPSTGQSREIKSRVYADPGESGYMKTLIDDVRVKKGGNLVPVNSLLLLND